VIEEIASKQAHADAEFQDVQFLGERAFLVGFEQRREEDFGHMA
jgi:hypothetical protein